MRDQIFISYSHADSMHQLRLRKHLATFERACNIKYWSDTQLVTGDLWETEIKDNINKAAVAIFMISADFLDSEFIHSNELKPLLDSWKEEGVYILPVIVKPCNFNHVASLNCFQAVNDPKETIEETSPAQQERTWANLAEIAYQRLFEYKEKHQEHQDKLDPFAYQRDHQKEKSFASSLKNDASYHVTQGESNDADGYWDPDFQLFEYLRNLLEKPEQVLSYLVYPYEHIDILSFLPKAIDFLGDFPGKDLLLQKIKLLFFQNGWEGDGDIRLMWFPPFLRIGIEDSWGTLAWFVKQYNNGTAFIASPTPIPYLKPADDIILYPDKDGYYTAQIAEVRAKIRHDYRCYRLRGLLDKVSTFQPNETHWILYHAGDYADPAVNDQIKFKVKTVCDLRDFPDIKNTRNIYLKSMEIISK